MDSVSEVSVYITEYIIKRLLKCFGCNDCKHLLLSEENVIENKYIKLLNRGCLLIPSSNVCFYSSKCFPVLEVIFDVVFKYAGMILETVLNTSWISIYHQLTFVVPFTIHLDVSGCVELFQIYLSVTIKTFQIQKFEKIM